MAVDMTHVDNAMGQSCCASHSRVVNKLPLHMQQACMCPSATVMLQKVVSAHVTKRTAGLAF